MKPQTLAAIMKPAFISFCIVVLFGCIQTDTTLPDFEIPQGGYNYPVAAVDTGFFFYPVSGKFSKRDSFNFAWYGGQFFNAFGESNLSINPKPTPELRLAWEDGSLSSSQPVVIVVRRGEIEVKEGVSGDVYTFEDTMILSEIERSYLSLLERFYPLTGSEHSQWRRKFFESLIEKNPELASPTYYMALKKKSATKMKPFKYKSKIIPLEDRDYLSLLQLISSSGFWSMPYMLDCPSIPTDAGGFIFEVNTYKKYNMVRGLDCPGDTSLFRKACQKVVEFAGMQEKINLLWR